MTMLAVENLSLYYGAAQALRGVSVSPPVGEVTCVLGRNGVGKTSLLRAIVGHRPITGGSIVFEGQDITRLKPFERAALGIAYVPQGREIFPLLTVRGEPRDRLRAAEARRAARFPTRSSSCSRC